MVDIVSVYRTEIRESHGFKQITLFQQDGLYTVIDVLYETTHYRSDPVDFSQYMPYVVFAFIVGFGRGNIQQLVV